MSEWQPIETAPRDGTAIWIAVEGTPFIGYFQPPTTFSVGGGHWVGKASFKRRERPELPDEIYGCLMRNAAPTNWMPLPAAPALTKGQQ